MLTAVKFAIDVAGGGAQLIGKRVMHWLPIGQGRCTGRLTNCPRCTRRGELASFAPEKGNCSGGWKKVMVVSAGVDGRYK